MEKERWRRERK